MQKFLIFCKETRKLNDITCANTCECNEIKGLTCSATPGGCYTNTGNRCRCDFSINYWDTGSTQCGNKN